MSRLSETVLLVHGARELTGAVREVLRDWSAIDLVSQLLWIDVDVDGDGDEPAGVFIAGGDIQIVQPSQWLARYASRVGAAQPVVLQIPGTDAVLVPEIEIADCLSRIRLSASRPVQVIAPGMDTPRLDLGALWPAHVNLVLQPVDGYGPHAQPFPLQSSSQQFGMHVAAGIASVAGLWRGVEVPVWNRGGQQRVGQQVSVGRSYFRRLDGSQVLQQLEAAILPVGPQLPPPYRRSRSLPPVERSREPAVIEDVASSLVQVYPILQFHPPADFVPPAPKRIRLLQAIRDLLAFIATSLIALPGEWARRSVKRAEVRLNQAIVGSDSAFQIQLGRVSEQSNDAVAVLRGQVSDELALHRISPSAPDTAGLWQSVRQTLCGLADGDELPAGVSEPSAAGERAVLSDATLLVVDPEAEPYRLDYGVLSGVDGFSIPASDPLAGILLDRQFAHALAVDTDSQATSNVSIGERQLALRSWLQCDRSLMGRLVHGLGTECARAIDALEGTSSEDEFLAQQQLRQQVNASQRKVRRTIVLSLLVLVAALAVVVGLAVLAVVSILIAAVLALIALVSWMVIGSWAFLTQQRTLYKLLHRMDVDAARRRWAADAVVQLLGELDRLTAIYRQATLWSRIFSAAISRPFGAGKPADALVHRPGLLRGELPLSMAIGTAEFDQVKQRGLLSEIRESMFGVGWLGRRFQLRLKETVAGEDMPERALEDIWSNSGLNPRDPLNLTAEQVGSAELDATMRQASRSELVTWLERQQARVDGLEWMQSSLGGSVNITAGEVSRSEQPSVAGFVRPLLETAKLLPTEGFAPTGAAVSATDIKDQVVAAVGVVAPTTFTALPTSALDGPHALDRIVMRIDLSQPLDPAGVTWFAQPDIADRWPSVPDHGDEDDVGPDRTLPG